MNKIDYNKRVENIIKRLDYLEESCDESVLTDDSISDFLEFSNRAKVLAEKWNKQRWAQINGRERNFGDIFKKNKDKKQEKVTVDSPFSVVASEANRLKMIIK